MYLRIKDGIYVPALGMPELQIQRKSPGPFVVRYQMPHERPQAERFSKQSDIDKYFRYRNYLLSYAFSSNVVLS